MKTQLNKESRKSGIQGSFFPAILIVFIFSLLCVPRSALGITPFYIKTVSATNSAGSSQIGVDLLTSSTALNSPFTVNGTNLVFGGNSLSNFTFTLDSNGYTSNALYAGTYRFIFTNMSAAFIAAIPDTTNFQSLTLYITNIQVFPGFSTTSYQNLTNLLGFAPATNNLIGITNALGYTPATNGTVGIEAGLGFVPSTNSYNGITNGLGFGPATNSNPGITFALGFTPATNNYNGITNSLGLAPATNSNPGILSALGYTPPNSNYTSVTAALGFNPATNSFIGSTNALGYMPATNGTTGIEAGLGYIPKTNDGYMGLPAIAGNIVTNGFIVWVTYKTNDVPGSAFTNLPTGSLMSTTNGGLYVLSNIVWNPK